MSSLHCIIVTFRRPRSLQKVLEATLSQSAPPKTISIIDNGSSTEVAAVVDSYAASASHISYIDPGSNVGPAGGTRIGMERILIFADDEDWLIRIDDDRPPQPVDLLQRLVSFGRSRVDQDPSTAAVGVQGARWIRNKALLVDPPRHELAGAVAVDYLKTGHFPCFRVAAVRRTGLFRSDLFFGFSEVEYGLRLRKAGHTLWAEGDLWRALEEEQLHLRRPGWRVREPDWRRYYALRNLLFVLRENHAYRQAVQVSLMRGLAKPLLNLIVAPRAASTLLRLNAAAVRDGWLGRMGKTLDPEMWMKQHAGLTADDDFPST